MKRHFAFALVVAPAMAFTFGGWAVVTVDDLPEYAVAGTAVEIPFTVRQHGITLLGNLNPTVTMKSGGTESAATVRAGKAPGHYVATWTAPHADVWSVRIYSGFMSSENTLLPLRVVAAGSAAPRAQPETERGHRLFVAKGCVMCHMRGDEGNRTTQLAPDLTGRKYAPEYVAKFLDDPDSSPLSRTAAPYIRMPKLDLKQKEIASLVAFLNSEGQAFSVRE